MSAREDLIDKIRAQADPEDEETPAPVVSLEDFFDGNHEEGSIGCNLDQHPGIATFYETLRHIRDSPSVQDVLVRISAVEDDWPFSDAVYFVTSATLDEISRWLAPVKPDDVEDGLYWDERLSTDVDMQPGMRVVHAWWD